MRSLINLLHKVYSFVLTLIADLLIYIRIREMKSILAAFFVMLSASAVSDEYHKAINVTCAPEIGLFEVYATGIANADIKGDDLKEKYGLYFPKDGENLSLGCIVDDNKVDVEVRYDKSRSSGACGANPGGTLYISVNDKKILHHIPFDQSCYSHTLMSFKLDSYNLTVCGKMKWPDYCRVFSISTLLKSELPLYRSTIEN